MKLHTLRQDVDYAVALAKTTYGILGVKVWVSLGEILSKNNLEEKTLYEQLEVEKKSKRTFEQKGGDKNVTTKKN